MSVTPDVTVSMQIDESGALQQAKTTADKIKQQLGLIKISTSIDSGDFDKFAAKIGALRDQNVKVNVKVNDANEIGKIQTQIDKLNSGGANINGRFTVKSDNSVTQIQKELDAIQAKLQGIQSLTATGLVLKFSEVGLNSILNGLQSILSLVGNAFSSGLDLASNYELLNIGLTNSLQNTAKAQYVANDAFTQGKGTIDDYATVTGRNIDSLYKEEKVTGGVAKATSSFKVQLDKLKDAKRDITKAADKEIQQRQDEINAIQKTIRALEDEEKTKLASANATDKEIAAQDRLLQQQQRALDKQLTDKQRELDKTNKPELDSIKARGLAIDQELLTLQKRENLLNQAPNQYPKELKAINARQATLKAELSDLNARKGIINDTEDAEIDKIKTAQEGARDQIDLENELLQTRKDNNEQIKSDFEDLISNQKDLIDGLKQQIEDKKIVLDADISPIEDKINIIQDKIDNIQLAAAGSGGGSRTIRTLDPAVAADIAARNKSTSTDPRFIGKTREEINAILDQEAVAKANDINTAVKVYAPQSPFSRITGTSLATTLARLGIDPLAGVKDVNSPTAGILAAGSGNILNNASDLIAYTKTLNPGKSDEEATNDFIRSISELQGGQTKSFTTRFNIGSTQLDKAARQAGLGDKLIDDGQGGYTSASYANLAGEDYTKLISSVVDNVKARGLSQDLTKSFEGRKSNFLDQLGNVADSFFGKSDNPSSLLSKLSGALEKVTNALGKPEFIDAFSKLGERIGLLVEKVFTPENIESFATGIVDFVDGIAKMFSQENIETFVGVIQAIGDTFKEKGFLGLLTSGDIYSKGVGNAVNTQSSKVSKLQDQINNESDPVKKAKLQDQLGKEQGILKNLQDSQKSSDKNIFGQTEEDKQNNLNSLFSGKVGKGIADSFGNALGIKPITKEDVDNFFKPLSDGLDNNTKAFMNWGLGIVNTTEIWIDNTIKSIDKFFNQDIPGFLFNNTEAFSNWSADIVDTVFKFTTDSLDSFNRWTSSVKNGVLDPLVNDFGGFSNDILGKLSVIGNFFGSLPDKAKAGFEGIKYTAIIKFVEINNSVKDGIDGIIKSFKQLPDNVGKAFDDLLQQLKDKFKPLSDLKDNTVKNTGTILDNLKNFVFGGGRANGGSVFAGTQYTVNEEGRETFVNQKGQVNLIQGGKQNFRPNQDGFILPNRLTERLLGAMQGASNVSKQYNFKNYITVPQTSEGIQGTYGANRMLANMDRRLRGELEID